MKKNEQLKIHVYEAFDYDQIFNGNVELHNLKKKQLHTYNVYLAYTNEQSKSKIYEPDEKKKKVNIDNICKQLIVYIFHRPNSLQV